MAYGNYAFGAFMAADRWPLSSRCPLSAAPQSRLCPLQAQRLTLPRKSTHLSGSFDPLTWPGPVPGSHVASSHAQFRSTMRSRLLTTQIADRKQKVYLKSDAPHRQRLGSLWLHAFN